MSEIKKGDLAMVVRPTRCGAGATLGRVFVVQEVVYDESVCTLCGRRGPEHMAIETIDEESREKFGYETWRLKRIDPSSEDNLVSSRDEVKA